MKKKKFETITLQAIIDRVPERWMATYGRDGYIHNAEFRKIYIDLVDAKAAAEHKGKKLSKRTVDKIIGNTSWTRCTCDHCDKQKKALVFFGVPYDRHSYCLDCLIEAYEEHYGTFDFV